MRSAPHVTDSEDELGEILNQLCSLTTAARRHGVAAGTVPQIRRTILSLQGVLNGKTSMHEARHQVEALQTALFGAIRTDAHPQ